MSATQADLLAAARTAREHAYAPYSSFQVGAALLTIDGEIVTGTNVENASYSLTICAERSALFNAVSRGFREFSAIAIVGPEGVPIAPCGACRQALAEFSEKLSIVREGRSEVRLDEMLPEAFRPEVLR